jgi:hypothetical protein
MPMLCISVSQTIAAWRFWTCALSIFVLPIAHRYSYPYRHISLDCCGTETAAAAIVEDLEIFAVLSTRKDTEKALKSRAANFFWPGRTSFELKVGRKHIPDLNRRIHSTGLRLF